MRAKNIILAFVVVILLLIILFVGGNSTKQEENQEVVISQQTSTPTQEITILESHAGTLFDVTNGQEVRGVVAQNISGFAEASLYDNGYRLEAVFNNLPIPKGNDFYEGWIVRRGEDQSVISTGVLELENESTGEYSNVYTSKENLMDHDFYVLTLEPDDNDPAPADHILEGVLQ